MPSTFQPTLAQDLLTDVLPTHVFHWRKRVVAKALVIAGDYGVDAHKSRECCVKHGRK
jgi:hypothetical protein